MKLEASWSQHRKEKDKTEDKQEVQWVSTVSCVGWKKPHKCFLRKQKQKNMLLYYYDKQEK